MKKFKFIIIFSIIFVLTGCSSQSLSCTKTEDTDYGKISESQNFSFSNNKITLYSAEMSIKLNDDFNDYTYVDIDKSLKKHAEEKFLGKKLGANKKFVVNDANQFLNENKEKYDLIVLDSYSAETPPLSLVTAEYFQRVKDHVKEGGIVAMNIAAQPDFSDNYSTHIDNTLRAIFTHNLHSQVLKNYNPWISDKEEVNILYTWFNRPNSGEIYTNNKNRLSLDR